jgi:hypothetical protein
MLGVLLGVGLLMSMASPAGAIERVSKAQSLNAFWYSSVTTGPKSFQQTTWYVGAFHTTGRYGGTFSDLYRSVDNCRSTKRGTICTPVSFDVGYKELTKDEFYIDQTRLESGWIEATYDLQSYDATGNPVGVAYPTHILAQLEGTGDIERYHDKYVYEDSHFVFTFEFRNFFRTGEAHGWIDGVDIGETYEAYLSLNTNAESKRKA